LPPTLATADSKADYAQDVESCFRLEALRGSSWNSSIRRTGKCEEGRSRRHMITMGPGFLSGIGCKGDFQRLAWEVNISDKRECQRFDYLPST